MHQPDRLEEDRGPRGATALLLGLGPVVCMLVCLCVFHNVWAAMLCMHWIAMVIAPTLFLAATGELPVYWAFLKERDRLCWQTLWGSLGAAVAATSIVVGYCFIRCGGWFGLCVSRFHENVEDVDLAVPLACLVAGGVYFVLVNPPIEEMFWRVFICREFAQRCSPLLPVTPGAARKESVTTGRQRSALTLSPSLDAAIIPPSEEGGLIFTPSSATLPPLHSSAVEHVAGPQLCELGYVVVSLLYSSYHFLVVFYLMGLVSALLAFVAVAALGRLLIFCRDQPKLGLLTATLVHVGVDVGAAAVLGWIALDSGSR